MGIVSVLKIAFCYLYKWLRSMILKGFPKGEVTFFGVQEFFLGKSLVVFFGVFQHEICH